MERPTRYGAPDPEDLDTTPIEMPLGARRPTPIHELIARMVKEAVATETNEDYETFDESNDFDEEDPDTIDLSPYELVPMTEQELDLAALGDERAAAEPTPEPTGDPPDLKAEEPDQP